MAVAKLNPLFFHNPTLLPTVNPSPQNLPLLPFKNPSTLSLKTNLNFLTFKTAINQNREENESSFHHYFQNAHHFSVAFPALAFSNTLFFATNVTLVVGEDVGEEKLIGQFRREVLKAGVLQECRRRRFFESSQEKRKRKSREAARRNRKRLVVFACTSFFWRIDRICELVVLCLVSFLVISYYGFLVWFRWLNMGVVEIVYKSSWFLFNYMNSCLWVLSPTFDLLVARIISNCDWNWNLNGWCSWTLPYTIVEVFLIYVYIGFVVDCHRLCIENRQFWFNRGSNTTLLCCRNIWTDKNVVVEMASITLWIPNDKIVNSGFVFQVLTVVFVLHYVIDWWGCDHIWFGFYRYVTLWFMFNRMIDLHGTESNLWILQINTITISI